LLSKVANISSLYSQTLHYCPQKFIISQELPFLLQPVFVKVVVDIIVILTDLNFSKVKIKYLLSHTLMVFTKSLFLRQTCPSMHHNTPGLRKASIYDCHLQHFELLNTNPSQK